MSEETIQEKNDLTIDLEKKPIDISKKKRQDFKSFSLRKKAISISLILLISSLIINIAYALAMHYSPIINRSNEGMWDKFPGNFIEEVLILYFLQLVAFFLVVFLAPWLSKFFIFIHKIITFFDCKYSRVEIKEEFIKAKSAFSRILLPFLTSFLLGYWIVYLIFGDDLGSSTVFKLTLLYLLFSYIMMPGSILLSIPIWLLDDSGVIAIKKREEGERTTPSLEGASVYFADFLKGSTYTLAIITIVNFFIALSKEFQIEVLIAFFIVILILLPFEFLLLIYLYEIFMPKAKRKLIAILPDKFFDRKAKTIVDISSTENETIEK